ncbi:MAG: Flp pilus assembly protein CpaB [Burkholderiaceae bacterium]|nr:Flp pilus assembly protein CpaB [Burkholderiaceae bacterium]
MANRRAIIFLLLSLLTGATAVGVAAFWMKQKMSDATVSVVVASRDLLAGEKLTADNLKVVSWPSGAHIKGSSTTVQSLDGRVTAATVVMGEPILEGRLAPVGSKAGLSAIITPGHRALTVKVNEVVGVAGFAMPGNYVDVLVTIHQDNKPPISKIVLEKILVLATAQEHMVRDEAKPKVVNAVTLEVTPEQAEKLDLARSVGTLSMALRNQIDQQQVTTRGALIGDVLKAPSVSMPKASAREVVAGSGVPEIEVIRGVVRTNVSVR